MITMLPAGKHVLSVWNEVVPAMAKGALIIDCSTIDVESSQAGACAGAKHGVASVDAPVSGGTGGAKGATLTFMCGGDDEAFAAAKPVLENDGQEHRALRRRRRRAGGEDLQQHDPRHLDDRRSAKRLRWPKSSACRIRRCSTSPRPRRASAGR